MSRNNLKAAAAEFIQNASWLKKLSNFYYIDFLFPSLGVVDLLTSHFRSNFTLEKDDKKLLAGICFYLSEYVASCWEECGLDVEVYFDENGALISIRGLSAQPIHLQSTFSLMLANMPKEIAIDRNNKFPFPAQGDFVCSFVQGFLRGAYFENSHDIEALFGADLNEQIDKVLAKQFAKWHEVVTPELTISHLPELYLSCLKNRHFLASEEAPMVKEVKEFIKYFKTLNIDPAMAGRKLSKIFVTSPCEYLSLLGAALLGGLDTKEPSLEEFLPSLKARSYAVPLLRDAFYFYRNAIGYSGDWIKNESNDADSLKLVEIDRQIGFLPWLRLSNKYLGTGFSKEGSLREFLGYLKEGNFFLAQSTLDRELEEDPANIDFRIQRAFFYFVTRDLESGHEYCKKLLSENNIERYYEFFSVWGAILLELKQVEIAIRYLKLAYNAGDSPKFRKAEIGNTLAWCYILQGFNDEAKVILDEVKLYPSLENVSILLNRLFISEKSDEMPRDLLEALRLAPMDRRVFNNVILLGKARVEKGELKI